MISRVSRITSGAWPDISRHVWETKYRHGEEASVADTWRRVATAVAGIEGREARAWAGRFAALLEDFRFLPGGRILAGAGTVRDVTLMNCFVMGPISDSLDGIFDGLKEGALTMQRGGGVGYDFSTLRPSGTVAQRTGSIASGPVSFMRIWDAMCATMLSTGARRGAMMATLRCDHPDVEAFVEAKRDPQALRHFNVSVLVTDAFMSAVREGAEWPLRFPCAGSAAEPAPVMRTVDARALWQRILRAAYDTAEPGVLFIDRINAENNLRYCEHLTATNPCGEIPLPAYGACNLGSLNLPAFVRDPFGPGARVDLVALEVSTRDAIRFLDDVIDLSKFPLPQQAEVARASRRVGLGVTGLADALVMMGHRYESWTARGEAAAIMRTIRDAAYAASVDIAREKGAFPAFEREAYLAGPFVRRLPAALQEGIARFGIRNSHLLAIAPAGTISLLAGNLSSGIEPIFSLRAERRVLAADGEYRTHEVEDYAWRLWRAMADPGVDEAAFVTAAGVSGLAHLQMQAALQPFVDNAISKTVNVAAGLSFAEFHDLYSYAYGAGLKGCTVFRPNPVRGEILVPVSASRCCDVDREAD
jgi:ribonucleoside-diphosphate reductase alpha chain